MDDLSSIDWASSKGPRLPNGSGQGPKGNHYPVLRPTPPVSGRSTPSILNPNGTGQKPLSNVPSGSKSSTPLSDSFANLVSFNAAHSTKTLSLQEQQAALQEQKTRHEEVVKSQFDGHFGLAPSTSHAFEAPRNFATTRNLSPPAYVATEEHGGQKLSKLINKPFVGIPNGATTGAPQDHVEDDADLLAAFSSSAPVDKSSHMPAVSENGTTGRGSFMSKEVSRSVTPQGSGAARPATTAPEDDDPFGLGSMAPSRSPGFETNTQVEDTDDVLGLLGRPVSEFPRSPSEPAADSKISRPALASTVDCAIAELVDMGFTREKAIAALQTTGSGADIQEAVGWLLNQAHEDSRKERQIHGSRRRNSSREQHQRRAPGRRKSSGSGGSTPAWMKEQGRAGSTKNRQDTNTSLKSERDPAQLASELSNNLFKTANSLWKTSSKKLNQAVAEFNSETNSGQPKWMRETHLGSLPSKPKTQGRESDSYDHDRQGNDSDKLGRGKPPVSKSAQPVVTDEALLLESGDGRPQRKHGNNAKERIPPSSTEVPPNTSHPTSTKHRDPVSYQPEFTQQAQSRDPRSRLNRQAVEEEAAQAYVSPARRKRTAPKSKTVESEPDLLVDDSKVASPSLASDPRPNKTPSASRQLSTSTLPTRPKLRAVPPVSPAALQQSTAARQAGTAAFRRGDYAQATIHYTTAHSALPSTHPLIISILTNRALSYLKTGDPKACIADAKSTLEYIGPSHGKGECIDLGSEEGVKSINSYWGKAMMRQAEALEQLERWADAAASWRACVEVGVGGATSIAGRNRCENASKPQPAVSIKKTPIRSVPRPSALDDLTPTPTNSTDAVTRLRAANAAADKLDDEKFALADLVDARIMKWRAGKEGNLRALLSSLETVLWEGAGWKKVGMGDVLLPSKVKLVYMKGIAKVHPDKVRHLLPLQNSQVVDGTV